MRNKLSGGFILAEFAIALPLLILLGCGLAVVGVKILEVGKNQLADYVLEAEAQQIIEQITKQARVAEEIEIKKFTDKVHQVKIVYHTVNEHPQNPVIYIADVRETQYYIPRKTKGVYDKLYAKRHDDGNLTTPMSGDNSFGETKINRLQYSVDAEKKIFHITLELESLVSAHKIKIASAVFMPGYGS